ncbi:MAG TPA: TolC family protein [Cyclobacteriaceae bacterium]|nr:TolC family protein [Cyclobacteriaceae bacterium]
MTAKIKLLIPLAVVFLVNYSMGQEALTMTKALQLGLNNYGVIKSKAFQVESSRNSLSQARRDYVPNVVLGAQQVYGTVNGQNGPLYGFGGFAVSSSGLPLPEQNWNAGFGALYLANFNWEVFSFGRARGRIRVADAAMNTAEGDLEQEQFQHQVRVAAAYLNALGSGRVTKAQQKNLERAQVIQRDIVARTKGGLRPGVDSAFANAEVAAAKIALLRAADIQQEQEQNLAFLIGVNYRDIQLDTSFVAGIPVVPGNDTTSRAGNNHPTVNLFQRRVDQSLQQLKLGKSSYYPSINLVGIFQTRASGFAQTYAQDQSRYTNSYSSGVKPTISNYLVGVGLTWNLATIYRTNAQVQALKYNSLAMEADLQLTRDQLKTQLEIADAKLVRALQIKEQVPIQVSSAVDAYMQRSTLYKSGLSNLVDITQAMYLLNRAESDRDLAYINVWQALLLKAAATGDLSLFTNQLSR